MLARTTDHDFRPQAEPADTAALVLLLTPFLIAAVVDVPRVVQLGPLTGGGALTILQCMLAGAGLIVARSYPRSVLLRTVPYALFLGWMILRTVAELPNRNMGGVQNAFTYVLFGANVLVAGTLAFHRPAATLSTLRRGFGILDTVTIALVALSLLLFGLGGPRWIVGPRSVALLAIVPVGWHLAGWSYGRRGEGIRALVWIAAVVLSLSRAAMAVALLSAGLAFLAGGQIRPIRLFSRIPALAFAGVVLLGVVLTFQAEFRERFFGQLNVVDVAG